ncbi:MAG TPA: hypothetical protein VMS09_07275 [Paenibacillus sp.]|uniref:hypothetical protein n=1 Tax=Paenibacillus sp. TaxID=58172 RepID=UPI002B8396BB|nr:hypothetical protein [Paenibacillus sp.]HUC91812.1 hypothetical protein [Paenibacillus sp.]
MRNKGNRKPGLRAALLFLLALLLLAAGCSGGGNDAASDSAGGGSESADRGTADRGDSAASEESAEPGAGDELAEGGEGGEGGGVRRPVGEQPQAAPGQLTAGEWRDADNWQQWQSLLNSREGDSYRNT